MRLCALEQDLSTFADGRVEVDNVTADTPSSQYLETVEHLPGPVPGRGRRTVGLRSRNTCVGSCSLDLVR